MPVCSNYAKNYAYECTRLNMQVIYEFIGYIRMHRSSKHEMYHFSLYISFLHVRGSCLVYTRARTTHMRHTCVPHTKTKVQSKVQLQGETGSGHEDVKLIGIGG